MWWCHCNKGFGLFRMAATSRLLKRAKSLSACTFSLAPRPCGMFLHMSVHAKEKEARKPMPTLSKSIFLHHRSLALHPLPSSQGQSHPFLCCLHLPLLHCYIRDFLISCRRCDTGSRSIPCAPRLFSHLHIQPRKPD